MWCFVYNCFSKLPLSSFFGNSLFLVTTGCLSWDCKCVSEPDVQIKRILTKQESRMGENEAVTMGAGEKNVFSADTKIWVNVGFGADVLRNVNCFHLRKCKQ